MPSVEMHSPVKHSKEKLLSPVVAKMAHQDENHLNAKFIVHVPTLEPSATARPLAPPPNSFVTTGEPQSASIILAMEVTPLNNR